VSENIDSRRHDLLRRIGDRIKELQAKEKEDESAQGPARESDGSVPRSGPVAGRGSVVRGQEMDQALKRSQIWLTYEATRANNPHLMPARRSLIDEKGNLIRMNERTGSRPEAADSVVREKDMVDERYERPKPKSGGDTPSGRPPNPPIPPQEDPKTA
jgi:hypothetical protein